jgi:hypothetical protein
VTRIFLQDFSHDPLRRFQVIGQQRCCSLLYERSVRIRKPCAIEGDSSVGKLLEVDECISVSEPCEMMMRNRLQHPSYFLPRSRRTSVAPVGACQIHSCLDEIRCARKHSFEQGDALGNSV